MKKYFYYPAMACLFAPLAMAVTATSPVNTPPIMTSGKGWVTGQHLYHVLGTPFDPKITAWDVEDGDLTNQITPVSTPNVNAVGSYTVKYQVYDKGVTRVAPEVSEGRALSTFVLTVDVFNPANGAITETIPSDTLLPDNNLMGMGSLTMNVGGSISRTFRIAASATPVASPEVSLTQVIVKESVWGGNSRQMTLTITDVSTNQVVYQGATSLVNSGTSLTLTAPVTVQVEKDYGLSVKLTAGNTQGFRATSYDTGKLWLKLVGNVSSLNRGIEVITQDPANTLAFDPGLANPLKSKLLSSSGGSEALIVDKTTAGTPLTYQILNPTLAEVAVTTGSTSDRLVLSGKQPGITALQVWSAGMLVDTVRLVVVTPKILRLSYSYIAYPAETQNLMWTNHAAITNAITQNYARYNLSVRWQDLGALVYEWDLNGDGDSYDPNYTEVQAPITMGVIPNQTSVFSNVYTLRRWKSVESCNSNGNGSSIGFGPTDVPPRAAFRSGCPNTTIQNYHWTLTHELGHNLGLSHYAGADPNASANFMVVGTRYAPRYFDAQWQTLHATLDTLLAAGAVGVELNVGQ